MKNNSVNTRFFNFRLFLEALKRLRVVGLASAILAITASALIPAAIWIEQGSYSRMDVYEMDTQLLCVPAGGMVLLAPLFFFVLFSFLQKRKESDFFHAIPYTRTCVYVSFTAAALAFVWAIQIACGAVAGVLWSMIPRLTADIGGMIAYVAVSMLAAAMLSSFMMLALSVSGTGGSCTLLFFLFASFIRVVCAVFLGCIDTMYLVDVNSMWGTSVLSPLWFLPINVLYYWGDAELSSALLYSLPNILYSLGVTLAVFAFAGFLYNRRKSEMAGNPAPGVRTQALFRILFTTLPALLIPLLLVTGDAEGAIMLVLVVGVLLVYFLYELITTKRPKNLLKIFPGLGIVAGICVAFLLAFGAYYTVTVNETVTADEVKWISIDSNGFSQGSYQGCLADTLRTDDPEILKTVTERLSVSQRYERESGSFEHEEYHDRMAITIRLKSGRTLYRYVSMGKAARESVHTRFAALDEVRTIMFLLPTDSEVQTGGIGLGYNAYVHWGDREKLQHLLDTFRTEFESLSEEQKTTVMGPSIVSNYTYAYDDKYPEPTGEAGMILTLHGSVRGQRFSSDYVITDAMPRTRELMAFLFGADQLNRNYYYVANNESWDGSPETVMEHFEEDAADPDFTDVFPYLKGHTELTGISADAAHVNLNTTFMLEAKDYTRLSELLRKACAVTPATSESDFTLTDGTYYLYLYNESDGKYTSMNLCVCGVFRFTPEELKELKEILQIKQ